jgi:hypothetical protein
MSWAPTILILAGRAMNRPRSHFVRQAPFIFLLAMAGCTSPAKIQDSQTTVIFEQDALPTGVNSPEVTLTPGESAVVEVWARLPANKTRIRVTPGMRLRFLVPPNQTWTDWLIQKGAGGYAHGPLPFIQEPFAPTKPLPGSNWFALVGQVDRPKTTPFLIGEKPVTRTMKAEGELLLFANDARDFYWNNFGRILVVITRVE